MANERKDRMVNSSVAICVSPTGDALQKEAARQLQCYLKKLFNIDAATIVDNGAESKHRFVLGLSSDSNVQQVTSSLPNLSSQGYLLRRVCPGTIVLTGGSSQAVAWAVYELVKCYGVRFLLHEDVFPEGPRPFFLPQIDKIFEPLHQLRCWDSLVDLATGSILWGFGQQKCLIEQLFKLKFNSLSISLGPQQPFVDYEVQGIRRQTGELLYGQRIPIDEQTIGREHLMDSAYLTNPEFLGAETFEEKLAVGRRLVQGIIDQAKHFQMHTIIHIAPFEFPKEFRPLLQQPNEKSIQCGDLTCAEQGDLTNPNHLALVQATIEAPLKQYNGIDEMLLCLPEHPQAQRLFESCWAALAAKYKLEPEFDIDRFLSDVCSDGMFLVGGVERAEREFKSSVAMLHFFDGFFARNDILRHAESKHVRLGLSIGFSGSATTLGFVDRLLWPEATICCCLDYTSSRAVRRMHLLEAANVEKVPASLVVTLQDDNNGSLPQIATENIHILLQMVHRLGWRGFHTRHWPIGDLDPMVAYLAQVSWDGSVTPRSAYVDHFSRVYGEASTEPLCQVMRILEDATVILDLDFLGLLFPVPTIMSLHVKSEAPMPDGALHIRAMYQQCRKILLSLKNLLGPPARVSNLDYWISRLDFAIEVLREYELLCCGGVQIHAAKAEGASTDEQSSNQHLACAADFYRRGIAAGEKALEATAANVRDDSDRATLAAYYHFLIREVKQHCQNILDIGEND